MSDKIIIKLYAFRWKDCEENITCLMSEILIIIILMIIILKCTYRALGFIYT